MTDNKNQNVNIITGANSGFGKEAAIQLARLDAKLITRQMGLEIYKPVCKFITYLYNSD